MAAPRSATSCCSRCASDVRGLGDAASRRHLLKAAVFRPQEYPVKADSSQYLTTGLPATLAAARGQVPDDTGFADEPGFPDASSLARAVFGTVLDVSPQVLILSAADGERRLVLAPDAVAWRGAPAEPATLRPGDHAVARVRKGSRDVADRIWANIGRVTGTIVERSGSRLVIDEGATRKRQVVVIQPRYAGRIQVRFPALEPGYLLDIIGLRREGELDGMIPATSQPVYPVANLPAPPLVSLRSRTWMSGSATWHEPRDEPPGILGLSYPALDPQTRCAEDAASGPRHGFARMPYLAIGSVLRVTNECTGSDCLLPVTGCASVAKLFNDRCVTCGTSPRGRIADLTLASFVALGGELERGCFNVTVKIGA
jgi:hypothetical protein